MPSRPSVSKKREEVNCVPLSVVSVRFASRLPAGKRCSTARSTAASASLLRQRRDRSQPTISRVQQSITSNRYAQPTFAPAHTLVLSDCQIWFGAAASTRPHFFFDEPATAVDESASRVPASRAESGIRREVLSRWWIRYQQEGRAGLEPRSRRPQRSPRRIAAEMERRILRARRRAAGPARIAIEVGVSPATVYRVLARHGRNRLHTPVRRKVLRYEKSRPGELLHMDLKYLRGLDNPNQEFEYCGD